jgi:hypothetical protein
VLKSVVASINTAFVISL